MTADKFHISLPPLVLFQYAFSMCNIAPGWLESTRFIPPPQKKKKHKRRRIAAEISRAFNFFFFFCIERRGFFIVSYLKIREKQNNR